MLGPAAEREQTTTTARVTLMGEVRRLGSGGDGSSIGSAISQVILVGLPLTLLVAVAAVALWSLSGPPVPELQLRHTHVHGGKAHMSPQHHVP